MVSMMFDSRTPIMPFICTNRVVGIITQPEPSLPSKKVPFAGPSFVVPLPSTTSIAAAQAHASPKSHARKSSNAQNDGNQSTATSFAPPVNHRSDIVRVCMRSFFILCEGAFLISSYSDWFYPSHRK